ncbi:MAG: hypothetical protein E4H32_09985, partial [Nitrospirales bacterium]
MCSALLLTTLCLPAQALTIAGLIPATLGSASDQGALDQSGLAFANVSVTSVRNQFFEKTAALTI